MTQTRDQDVIVEHLIGYLLKNDEVIAQDYESTACALEERASVLREWAERRRRKKNNRFHHVATIRQIEPHYVKAQAEGVADPVTHVANALGIPADVVDVWVAYVYRQEDCNIIEMPGQVYSKNEIGAQVGMHFRSAQRGCKAQYGDEKIWSIVSADEDVAADHSG